ncbi:MAG: hypothetical protein OM95_14825 [Bdellovibrio sp. ArHS]|uniref:hypothetical protein n=1 Tax=Bdellovibrio sp. ArHS TaxID=1569284 RepID=UPI000583F5BC|nr:hypothetical protein [Bdellovibrio sp. ArHS]KHD87370.1 MAG: hypothetical protein OM95_14825 [Bdellovibrio sp. ArHS]
MKSVLAIFVLLFSVSSFAADSCENHAKAAAIRLYKKVAGAVQGSEGIHYWSAKIDGWNNPFLYKVTIADSNEDGDTWQIDYEVKIEDRAGQCQTLSVTEVDSRYRTPYL